jgi:pyridoxal biosynthesis lyase PdxS
MTKRSNVMSEEELEAVRNDSLYAYEVLDRLSVVIHTVDESICTHPFVVATPELGEALSKVMSSLGAAYQLAGTCRHKLEKMENNE